MSATDERQRHRAMIERACQGIGIGHTGWRFDEAEGRDQALLGLWIVTEPDENEGMYEEGEEGQLTATVVGAPEHNNERVAFYFTPEGSDEPLCQVTPFENVEPG